EVEISSVRPRPAPAPPRGPKTKVRKRAQTAKDQKSRASSKKDKDKGKSAPGRRQPRPKRKRRRVGRTRASGEASYKVDPKAATKIDRRYRKNLKTKTLTVGSLQGNIRHTLRNRALENPAQAELVSTVMLDAVRTLQHLRIAVYEIIALDISQIFSRVWDVSASSSSSPSTGSSSMSGPSTATSTLSTLLTKQDLEDLEEILESAGFYYALASLLLEDRQGAQAGDNQNAKVEFRRVSPRRPVAESSRVIQESHALRAFRLYQSQTGFIPFRKRPGARFFETTVPRLTVSAVHAAVRTHYKGSRFLNPDGSVEKEIPRGRNAIVHFFDK
ncbi:hypothetical protein BGX23_004925, partial [Mortierella sp. AD031]